MSESILEMMARMNADLPSKHLIMTSVGLVNLRNKNAARIAANRLMEKKREKQKHT